ncbi:MAG: NTP transferase domain-containing protein [Henriciella sp.]|nr:NTP transferase domain-containing protein [Henriciella sp.]
MTAMTMTGEHPHDVLSKLADWQADGRPCALVIVTGTEGGAVRAPGALMAISDHASFGYISGGCIDADVVLQARQALTSEEPRTLRYGAGSPFVDLPLPCGGAIDVLIVPNPAPQIVLELIETLSKRCETVMEVSPNGTVSICRDSALYSSESLRFRYAPKMRLRIAGRGADALALGKIADASGIETRLQLLDEADLLEARHSGLTHIDQLTTVTDLPEIDDDAWTAFVLLFHDRDLEIPLLLQALAGPAFYIGAVGSRKTHQIRCDALREAGGADFDINRIHGPIGLVPSLRDASAIALSTLAEIISVSRQNAQPERPRTAMIMLAAGASSRFQDGDKLLADLNGQSVLTRAARALEHHQPQTAIAVIAKNQSERGSILKDAGWTVIENDAAARGQSTSIQRAMAHLRGRTDIDQVLILLGDMPNVPAQHLDDMLSRALDTEVQTIMSESDGVLGPPALFKRQHFDRLAALSGDQGAKAIFSESESGAQTIKLSPFEAMDIDRVEDLSRAMESEHA